MSICVEYFIFILHFIYNIYVDCFRLVNSDFAIPQGRCFVTGSKVRLLYLKFCIWKLTFCVPCDGFFVHHSVYAKIGIIISLRVLDFQVPLNIADMSFFVHPFFRPSML